MRLRQRAVIGNSRITLIEGAIAVPPPRRMARGERKPTGILRADGSLVDDAVTLRRGRPVTLPPILPSRTEELPGTWLFMGHLFTHFGHFLVESLSRIWGAGQLQGQIDGAVFLPHYGTTTDKVLPKFAPVLACLGAPSPVRIIDDPTRIERLFVPTQGLGVRDDIEGTPEFRAFVRSHAGAGIEPSGPAKLYISRSRLPETKGGLLGETFLEERMAAEGYTIFHPQEHSIETQVAAYKAATHIVGVDGSPFHLTPFFGSRDQRVAIIARRSDDYEKFFVRQIQAFQGAKALGINCVVRDWIARSEGTLLSRSWGEVDFSGVEQALKQGGLIEGRTSWPQFSKQELDRQVEQIGAVQGSGLVPHERSPRAARLATRLVRGRA